MRNRKGKKERDIGNLVENIQYEHPFLEFKWKQYRKMKFRSSGRR